MIVLITTDNKVYTTTKANMDSKSVAEIMLSIGFHGAKSDLKCSNKEIFSNPIPVIPAKSIINVFRNYT